MHGRARHEAARRRKSECKVNLGNRKSSRSNSLWQMTTKTVSQNHAWQRWQMELRQLNYSVRALRVGQYARYKHCRRSLLDGRAVAGPISGPPTLARKVGLFTAQCTLVQMRGLGIACRLSVCLSVCPSVTLVICDHIGWKS